MGIRRSDHGKASAVSGRVLIGVLAAVLAVALGAASCGGAEPKSQRAASGAEPVAKVAGQFGTSPVDRADETNPAGAGEVGIARVPDMNIVGGEDVDISALPWTVALFHSSYPNDNLCGGVLVSPTRVLTAGHCVVEANHMLGPTGFRVVAGRTRLNEGGGQEIAVAKVWAAAKYDIERYSDGWDYGILDLATAATPTPVALPGSTFKNLWRAGNSVVAAGWGCQYDPTKEVDCEDVLGSPLKGTNLNILQGLHCEDRDLHSDTELCLAGDATTSTCVGDSGGPYVIETTTRKWFLLGSVSYGRDDCAGGYPEVGSFVPRLLDDAGHFRRDIDFNWCVGGSYCSLP